MFEVEILFCRADKDGIKIDDIRGYILSHLSEIRLNNTYLVVWLQASGRINQTNVSTT